jgi:hypothetical protein
MVLWAFYVYENRLFSIEAKIYFGSEKFEADRFKAGTPQDRSKMTADILKENYYFNVDCIRVREELGSPNGDYHISDSNLTYRLTDYGAADWILTFTCGSNKKIDSVYVRKSCCSFSQKSLSTLFDMTQPLMRKIIKSRQE